MNGLGGWLCLGGPDQLIDALERLSTAGLIDPPVLLDRTVDLAGCFDLSHDWAGRIPSVHQHRSEPKALLMAEIPQHLLQVIELALAVHNRIIDPVANDPELTGHRVHVEAGQHASIAAPLSIGARPRRFWKTSCSARCRRRSQSRLETGRSRLGRYPRQDVE